MRCAIVVAVMLLGCAPPPRAPASETRVYVIDSLRFPMPEGARNDELDGFDLDGTDADVCGERDWTAPAELGGGHGVDDAFGAFLGSIADASTQARIDAGEELLLVEVTDIDDFIDDANVGVAIHVARLRPGATAEHVGACTNEPSDPSTAPDCRLAPGQAFDVVSSTLMDGAIVGGRLRARVDSLPLELGVLDSSLHVVLRDVRLDVAIGDSALTLGVVGGHLDDTELLTSLIANPSLASYASVVAPALAAQSDLLPTDVGPCTPRCPGAATCDTSTMRCLSCSAASAAIDFSGVLAARGDG